MKIDFSKGIYTNTEPINTPPGFYKDATNMRIDGGSKRSEEGNIKTLVPDNIKVWGDCSIADQTIILGQKEDSVGTRLGSVIGVLDKNGSWVTIVDRGVDPDIIDINAPTQIEGRKDWKGDRLIYFATPGGARKINLDTYNFSWGDEDFDKNSTLFLEYDLPQAKYISEDNNGELLSGVYQAYARLLTESGAETVFGIGSSVVPVVPDSLQSSRDDINGAPVQTVTSKAITFRIENIDTSFKYIELAIVTYIGLANTPVVYLMNKVLINGQTSIEVSYRGAPDNRETLTLEELIISGIAYETGEFLAQKDGALLIGAPKEAELPPIDWFRIAQNITSRYIVKEIPYAEALTFDYDRSDDDAENWEVIPVKETSSQPMDQGYKDPLTCALYKGYRRGEVYSLTLTPVFVTGVHGPTVHIPANDSVDTEATVDNVGPAPILATTVEVVNLKPGSSYDWCVSAVNSAGDVSDCSVSINVQQTGGPSKPENFFAGNITETQFTLFWDASVAIYPRTMGAYKIMYRDPSTNSTQVKLVKGSPPATTTVILGTYPITSEFYIIPVDSSGTEGERSDSIFVTQPGAPNPQSINPPTAAVIVEPPTNLIATNVESTRFTLSWTASVSPNLVAYRIYREGFLHVTVSIPIQGIDPDGGLLGTFISEELYNDDRYPDIPIGDGLRLHKFPTAAQQPLIKGDVETSNMAIRVLGIELSNIGLNDDERQYEDLIAGIIIGRVNRKGQETQLAQGILRPTCDVYYDQRNDYTRSILLGDGTVNWKVEFSNDKPSEFWANNPAFNNMQFLSPDIIHRLHTPEQGSYIYQHSLYKCNPYTLNNEYTGKCTGREERAKPNTFFKNITSISDSDPTLNRTPKQLDGSKRFSGPFGVPLQNGEGGGKLNTSFVLGSDNIEMCSSDGFVWLKTLDGTNIPNHLNDNGESLYHYDSYTIRGSTDNLKTWSHVGSGRPNFVLYAMSRINPKQYGPLDQMVAMFTHYEPWKTSEGKISFYNGDTFINKYGLTINDEAFYPFTNNDDQDSPERFIGFIKPPNASGIVYMWTESSNNYAYRHFIQPGSYNEAAIQNTVGSTPYYPEYKQLTNNKTPVGILNMTSENWIRPGYSSGYNNQYSAQPVVKPYPVIPKEDTELKASLVNRILYSAEVVQGEKADSYQIFLPNNFYDVPQQFGNLTDIYVNRELFASTNQVQWRLYFNTLATQVTSAGEAVLGTGGAFNRPAIPMQTVDGGHGGTTHWIHANNTIYGRIFVDKLQGRMFLLTDNLMDISLVLDDSERLRIQGLEDLEILAGSEPLRDRAFFRLGNEMISYDVLRKQYVSHHTYLPRWMFYHASFMYTNNLNTESGKLSGVFKHSVGITGVFYGNLNHSDITLVLNEGSDISKLFQSMELITKLKTEQGLSLPFDTFDRLEIWNDERNSGLIDIVYRDNAFKLPGIMEVLSAKIKDVFRMVIPRDIVIDPSIDIFDTSNHVQLRGDSVPAKWLPKIRGNFVLIKLITDNTKGPIKLFRVNVEATQNVR